MKMKNILNEIASTPIKARHLVLFSELCFTLAITQNLTYCLYLLAGYMAYRFSK